MSKLNIDEYFKLDYPVSFVRSEAGYEVWHPDFGRAAVSAVDKNLNKAIKELDAGRQALIEFLFDKGMEIPIPTQDEEVYSGRFVVRVPKDLHAKLARQARKNGGSLNQYIVYLLSERNVSDCIERQREKADPQLATPITADWISSGQNKLSITALTTVYPDASDYTRFHESARTSEKTFEKAA